MAEYDSEELLARCRDCFKLVHDTEQEQRDREREDLLYQIPENQWSDAAKNERRGITNGPNQTPPRPMLSNSLVRQPLQLLKNQAGRAHLGVNLHPVAEDADPDLAETLQGMYRRIERDGKAQQARLWAFDRAAQAGRGAYRVNAKYDEDADPTGPGAWDQEIVFQRILHQDTVYMDPAAQEADFSDAKWCLIETWLPFEDFKRKFPKAKHVPTQDGLMGMDKEQPGWVRASNGTKGPAIRVVEYWYKEPKEQTIKIKGKQRTRSIDIVYCAKLTGYEVLEEPLLWDGKYIPIVIVVGVEQQPVDGDRRWEGMVRPARDAQQAYNYAISAAVEDISRLSKAPYIGIVGQFETDKDKWDTLNVRNYPYVEYDNVDVGGKPANPPQPFPIDGSKLQLSLQMAEQAKGMVQSATSFFDPSLGKMPDQRQAQSGIALKTLTDQTDAGTSQYLDNLAVALEYEARVVLDLIPKKYDRPGRITQVLAEDDKSQTIMLNRPYVKDPRGFPAQPTPGTPQDRIKTHDLSQASKYSVSVDIGRSHQTRLQEGSEMLGDVLAKAPALMPLIGPTFFRFQDWPGAKEVADILQKVRDQQYPNLVDDKNPDSPEALKAKAQAMGMQMQQLQQQFEGAVKALETDQAKQQAQVQIAQIKADLELKIAEMNNAAKVLVARISSDKESENQMAEAQEELLATGIKVKAEAEKQAREHQHEREMQHEKMAHDVGLKAGGGTTVEMSKTNGEDNEREESSEMSDGQSSASEPEATA